MSNSSTDLVLLYDGLCGFCDRTVQFVLARDRIGSMQFAALQGLFARDLLSRHAHVRGLDSLVLVRRTATEETVLVQYAAVIEILRYLGGAWSALATVMRIVPTFVGDAGYAAFARMRYRLLGRHDACRIPSPEQRGRFLD